jgi:alpha-tubulin suppressor-like RCC1 family protein
MLRLIAFCTILGLVGACNEAGSEGKRVRRRESPAQVKEPVPEPHEAGTGEGPLQNAHVSSDVLLPEMVADSLPSDDPARTKLQSWIGRIALGRENTYFIEMNASAAGEQLWIRGANDQGQRGKNEAGHVSGLSGNWTMVGAGQSHACAIARVEDKGVLKCFGANEARQLADSDLPTNSLGHAPLTVWPKDYPEGDVSWEFIDSSANHNLGIVSISGKSMPVAWGQQFNEFSQLGLPCSRENKISLPFKKSVGKIDFVFSKTAENIKRAEKWSKIQFVALATTQTHSCGIGTKAQLICWGSNRENEIGPAAVHGMHTLRTPIEPLEGKKIKLIAVGGTWGQKSEKETSFRRAKKDKKGNFIIKAPSSAKGFSIAIDVDGFVYGAGFNEHGQALQKAGPNVDGFRKVFLPGIGKVKYATAGDEFTILLTEDGKAYPFGNSAKGRLGLGNGDATGRQPVDNKSAFDPANPVVRHIVAHDVPVKIGNTIEHKRIDKWLIVVAGPEHACGVPDYRAVEGAAPTFPLFCWGANTKNSISDAAEPIFWVPTLTFKGDLK